MEAIMKQALILIDIQNIYFTPGKYQLFKPEIAAENTRKVLQYFRQNSLPIIHVKHLFGGKGYVESKDKDYLESQEYLCNFYKTVEPINAEIIIEKKYPNSFLKTVLKEELDRLQIDTLIIAGMMSHMCIDTTVRAAKGFDYQITVIDDACTTYDLKYNEENIPANIVHKVFMAALNGSFANVENTEQFLSNH
jgi:nicotinamidase-related amidase